MKFYETCPKCPVKKKQLVQKNNNEREDVAQNDIITLKMREN